MHGFTYSGHPVGGAIGLANLDIMEREGLVETPPGSAPICWSGCASGSATIPMSATCAARA